jgi:hypothetical protein
VAGLIVLTAPVGAQEPVQKRSCGKAPDVARDGARVAQAVFRYVMMAGIITV